MTNFIGILHIVAALVLIVLVLIQDSKSNGALGIGGGGAGGSNSLLGATGAQSLAGKMTVWFAIIFAVTCLTLSVITSSHDKSVVDSLPLPTAPATTESVPATATEAAPAAETAPAANEAPAN